jgi:hypothetical protein
MSKTLALGITLTAFGFGGAVAAFGTVNERIGSIGKTIDKLKGQQKTALQNMDREWVYGGNAVKKYATEVDKLDKKMQLLATRKLRLETVGAQHNANRDNLRGKVGDAAAAVGIGASMAVPGVKAAKFEDRVKQISIVGELYKEGGAETAMATAIRQASVKYAVQQDKVAEGVERLVAQGMDAKTAQKYAGLLAQVHTATRTDMGELAELVYTLQTKFKLTTEGDVMQAVNALAKAGKLGQYELKQMAKSFPELGGAAASFGSKGLDGVREMGMMMQVMRAGAGTTGDADTNMRNWFSHMSAKSTQDHFQKVGINFEKEKLKVMIEKRTSAIEASFMVFDDYLNKVTNQGYVEVLDKKGKVKERIDVRQELDKAMAIAQKEGLQGEALQEKIKAAVERVGLSSVLQDIQATNAYLAYRNGKGKYAEGRKELEKSSTNDTVTNDYNEQMKLATLQTEYMKVAVGDLMIEIGNRLAPVFGMVAVWIGKAASGMTWLMQLSPKITTGFIWLAGALAVAAGGFFAVGVAMAAFRVAGTAMALLPLLGGGFSMLAKGGGMLAAVLRGPVASAFRVAGTAVLWLGRALLMNPIGLAITAIALGAYLIYKNWEPIKGFFVGLWTEIKTAFNGGFVGIAKLITNWSPLGLFYNMMRPLLAYFGIDLPKSFTSFGSMLIDGLVGGVTAKLQAAKASIIGFGNDIKGWFTSTLGIQSPSRVFMGFGSNIGEGAEIGIKKSVPGVKSAVSKLAGVALAGAAFAGGGAAMAGGHVTGQGAAGGAIGGGINITFAPQITITGGGAGAKEGVQEALSMGVRDLERMMRRVIAEQSRTAF